MRSVSDQLAKARNIRELRAGAVGKNPHMLFSLYGISYRDYSRRVNAQSECLMYFVAQLILK